MSSRDEPSIARSLMSYAVPSLLVAAGGLGLARNRFQRAHLYAPQAYPHGIWHPRAYGLPARDVWFKADDGTRLHGWWVPARRPKARGVLLYCHGNSGNISTRVGALVALRRLGLDLFAFDYRGYGRSEGTPSEEGLYRDVRAAHDHLTGSLGRPASSILLFGHSLGGAVAVDAALHRQVGGLVVQSSFTDVRSMARSLFPRPVWVIARNQFRSIDKVSRIECPKLFVHGGDDPTVPIEMGRRLYERAAEPKDWLEIERGGHTELYRTGGLAYHWRLLRFTKRCLS